MPDAKTLFDNTIKRAYAQISLYKLLRRTRYKKKPKKIPAEKLSELLRLALVLGVSALDAYFTDKFLEKLIPYLRKHGPTKGIVNILEQAGFDTFMALKLILQKQGKRPFRKIRTLVGQRLETHTTQRIDAINKLFLSMGLKDMGQNAQKKAKRKNLLRRIEIAVERRHKIVHDGDLNNHGGLKKISLGDTKKRLKDIELFINHCDAIVNSRIS